MTARFNADNPPNFAQWCDFDKGWNALASDQLARDLFLLEWITGETAERIELLPMVQATLLLTEGYALAARFAKPETPKPSIYVNGRACRWATLDNMQYRHYTDLQTVQANDDMYKRIRYTLAILLVSNDWDGNYLAADHLALTVPAEDEMLAAIDSISAFDAVDFLASFIQPWTLLRNAFRASTRKPEPARAK